MGIWNRIFGRSAAKDSSSTDRPASWLLDWAMGGEATSAGVRVSPESAMRNAAVWACVNARSEDIGKVDCFLYSRRSDGGKQVELDHPAYRLINVRPNPRMTPFEFRQVMQANLDLRGDAFAAKEFDGRGELLALWPINSAHVTVLSTPDGYDLFYRVRAPGRPEVTLPAEAIVHIRGLSLNGMTGLSPIGYHRDTIGLAQAAERYGAQFFGNNAQPLGALKVPTVLSPEAAAKVRESWKKRHQGNRELAIFDGGLDWVATGLSNEDAQYIEVRKFQSTEIYRLYRMPPHKVGDLERSTNNNIEHQALEYVNDSLGASFKRWTDTLARDLLTTEEQQRFYFEFDTEDLLRGDLKSRMDAFAVARNWGILSADECRARLGENPIADGKGKVYLQPLNMIEAGTKPVAPAAPPPPPA